MSDHEYALIGLCCGIVAFFVAGISLGMIICRI